jgi:uncharacterized protein YjbI with pentapeptide repeats
MTALDTGPLACGTVQFQDASGALFVTVIVKATYALRPGALAIVTSPLDLHDDVYRQGSDGSLAAASDFAPIKLRADVVVVGSVHPRAPGITRQVVGFALARGPDVLLCKRLVAIGDRAALEDPPEALSVSPLFWERSWHGRDNPVGRSVPSFVDPDTPGRPAGLGPIAPTWPARAALLTKEDDAALRAQPMKLLPGLDLRCFQCAPPDQQLPHLLGGEQLLLVGLHPEHPAMFCRLPALHAHARLSGAWGRGRDVPLAGDTLWIDADRGLACITFRGVVEIASAGQAAAHLGATSSWIVHAGLSPCANVGRPREWLLSERARPRSPTVDPLPLQDESGLAVRTFPWVFEPGKSRRVVVVQGTFALAPEGCGPEPCEAQEELRGDEPAAGDPETELSRASDLAPFKPQADVLLRGTAHAPPGEPAALVRLELGSLTARLVATGPRSFDASGVPGPHGPFQPVPLRWENAYGGRGSSANPAGTGLTPGSPLPRLEDPDRLIRSRESRPPPACFGPIAPWWPARTALLGSYGDAWQRERWPHFPADFDPSFFQAAPPGLRLDDLRGDERYRIDAVRPGGGGFVGKLPGIRPRIFACRKDDEPSEVLLRLDTVLFDTDAGRVLLTWRGTFDHDPARAEVERLLVLREALDAPRSRGDIAAHAAALTEPRLAPPKREPRQPRPEPASFGEHVRRMAGGSSAAASVFTARASLRAAPPPPPRPPTKAEIEALVREDKPLAGRDMTGADLRGIDLSRQDLRGAILARARLTGARLEAANLAGANLSSIDAPDSIWTEANLSKADLTGAVLTRASFLRARLDGASLAGAAMGEVVLDEAHADGADLSRGDLSRARADGASLAKADLSGARLEAASLRGAKLDDAKLYEVDAEEIVLDEASLRDARFEQARLARASLRGAAGAGSVWECADLTKAVFRGADVSGAIFAGARLVEADLGGVLAREATFRAADMRKAVLDAADLMKASFEEARLAGASLRGASLYQAEVQGAELDGADLTLAVVAGTKLEG